MTLSRKYRPQNLDQLLGQDLLVCALNNSFINNTIPSSIILHGIRGTGKTTTARIIAKYLNCNSLKNTSGKLISCESCQSCISIKSGNHLDVIEIDAASHTGVDDARQIIDSVPYKALQGKFKVFIIDEVHMLSKSAFNALLKTLEEPPSHVKFIFATTEIKKIPETVLSRCLIFNLKKIKSEEIILNLKNICQQENITIEESALKQIAYVSGGSMRDALSLLDQVILVCLKSFDYIITLDDVKNVVGKTTFENLLEIFECIFTKNKQKLLNLIKEILDESTDPESVLQDLLEILSAIIKIKNGQTLEYETPFDFDNQKLQEILKDVQNLQLLNFWQVMIKGYEEIKNSPLPNQSLEILLLKLTFISDLPSISELIIKKKNLVSEKFAQPSNDIKQISAPKDFNQLLSLLLLEKELILHDEIIRFVRLVDYQLGKISINLLEGASVGLIKTLKKFLIDTTKMEWLITVSNNIGQETVLEKRNKDLEQKKEKTLQNDNVLAFKKAFPNANIHVEIIN